MKKKPDLQGLRGLAITSVLLFHFFPRSFPNGYLGVDQFFVLSGYLMTLIFGSREITKQTMQQFYYRRTKRILPLYIAVILSVYILMFFLLPPTFRGLNEETATRAVLLVSNMAKTETNNDYFVLLEQAADLFTHTWSLSCELQFYLLAPAVFFLFSSTFLVPSISFCFIFSLSLGYHLLADRQTSFNSVFCRLWQFQIGIAVSYCENQLGSDKDNEVLMEENDGSRLPKQRILLTKILFWLSFSLLLFCSLYPSTLPGKAARPISTVVSGTVILLGTHIQNNPLNWKVLSYLGDVSYSLYLVHWPLFVWVKYYYKEMVINYLATILFALVLAILVTETFERWYQTLEPKRSVLLLTTLYLLVGAVLLNTAILGHLVDGKGDEFPVKPHVSTEDAVRINAEFDKREYPNLVIRNCYPKTNEHGFCSFPHGNGTNRILVLGNSYTANLTPLVFETFGEIGGNISKFSNSYCEVLTVDSSNRNFRCKSSYKKYKSAAKTFEPDILFIIARTIKTEAEFENKYQIEDEIFDEMKETLDDYQLLVKKRIYILSSVPRVNSDHIRRLNEFIQKNFTRPFEGNVNQTFLNGQKRISRLLYSCSKCEIFDFNSVFIDSNSRHLWIKILIICLGICGLISFSSREPQVDEPVKNAETVLSSVIMYKAYLDKRGGRNDLKILAINRCHKGKSLLSVDINGKEEPMQARPLEGKCPWQWASGCLLNTYFHQLNLSLDSTPDKVTVRSERGSQVMPVYTVTDSPEGGLTVCLPPIFWYTDWTKILMFVEYWKLQEATQFLFYHQSSTTDSYKALEHYGIAEIIDWPMFPSSDNFNPNSEVYRLAHSLAQNDCILRGKTEFVTIIDFDELLVLRDMNDKNIMDLLKTIGKKVGSLNFVHMHLLFNPPLAPNPYDFLKVDFEGVIHAVYKNRKGPQKCIVRRNGIDRISTHRVVSFRSKSWYEFTTKYGVLLHARYNWVDLNTTQVEHPVKLAADPLAYQMKLQEILRRIYPKGAVFKDETQKAMGKCVNGWRRRQGNCKTPSTFCREEMLKREQWVEARESVFTVV